MRTVITIVFTRPIRSPSIPKISPPVAQPAMKIDVASPPATPRCCRRASSVLASASFGGGKQFLHRRGPGQHEELLVHRVEEPAHRGDGEHEPVVAIHLAIPGSTRGRGGSQWAVFKAVHQTPEDASRKVKPTDDSNRSPPPTANQPDAERVIPPGPCAGGRMGDNPTAGGLESGSTRLGRTPDVRGRFAAISHRRASVQLLPYRTFLRPL